MKSTSCQICGKKLTDPDSIARGVGPDCAAKLASFVASCGTTDTELSTLESAGGDAAKWVRNFRTEMRKGSTKAASFCLTAARRAAGHSEASALGLQDAAYFEYVNRRAAGESLDALRPPQPDAPVATTGEPPEPAIVVRASERGFRVHPPYCHRPFIAAFKATIGSAWYPEAAEWFIPSTCLRWAVELLTYWFSMPVYVEGRGSAF